VGYDPNSSVNIAARMSGRIEQMYVNYKYQKVNKGQKENYLIYTALNY
jgi:Cu(I)/Ag(I) efflux system membrane fusion protein